MTQPSFKLSISMPRTRICHELLRPLRLRKLVDSGKSVKNRSSHPGLVWDVGCRLVYVSGRPVPFSVRSMPLGMCPSQNCIGSPIIRCSMSLARRCAAIDNPYGPAPIMAMSELLSIRPLAGLQHFLLAIAQSIGFCTVANEPENNNSRPRAGWCLSTNPAGSRRLRLYITGITGGGPS
jgi:hypothetical protein